MDADAPKKGDRRFRVWAGPFSGEVFAGTMRFDGTRWVSVGKKHIVTDDVWALVDSVTSKEEDE